MREFLQAWVDAFRERKLLVYATAIAMRALIGLAGLTFLTLALLGAIWGVFVGLLVKLPAKSAQKKISPILPGYGSNPGGGAGSRCTTEMTG